MSRTPPPHYIRENKAARVPSRLIVVDTEAVRTRTMSSESQSWRCGAARFIEWTRSGKRKEETRTYAHPMELWADVAEFTKARHRTVLYAHNLPYDLRISQALTWLPRAEFKVEAIRIASQGAWSRWTRHGASLTLCDSASLFPVTVYTLAKLQGRRKPPMPDDGDEEGWLARCVADVEILAQTLVEYFEWLKTGVAGNWQVTGAGQSWAHWRHAHYTHQILVHGDQEAVKAERRAMWTGRAENWSWGKDLTAPVYEWDWQNAYPRLVRDNSVPVRLLGTARNVSVRDLRKLMTQRLVLAEVSVDTDLPLVPAAHGGRILWPIGTFDTTLWSPELEMLLDNGSVSKVHKVWIYRGEPALSDWSAWILDQIHRKDGERPPWAGILLKHWSRTLIGRFATQYQDWEFMGRDPVERVTTGKIYDADTGVMNEFMQIGHDIHLMTGFSESDDSCPQVTSFVMSLARARLWEAIQCAGPDNVLYMDTDSLVVNAVGNLELETAVRGGRFEGFRVKGRHAGYEIYGPRAALIGGEAKFSGIPRNAVRTGETEWQGEVWTQFDTALRTGEHSRVTIVPRRFSTRWNERRRARVAGGRTVPYWLPEFVPAGERGELEPVTTAEKVAYARRHLTKANG